ncbi:MAG: STAS domain-containing protein [Gammaproteobacteria bacterium]
MQFSAERHANVVVLKPAGRIDHQSAAAFGDAIEPYLLHCHGDGDRLLFDLSALDYISSAGLRVLMIASKRTRPVGGAIAVAEPSPVVREVLEITRFDLVFPVHDSVAAGVHALADVTTPGE